MKFVIVLGSNRSTFLNVLGSDIITFLIILGSERIAFLNVLGSDTTIYLIIVGSDRMQAERHISSRLHYDLPTGLMVITSPAPCITLPLLGDSWGPQDQDGPSQTSWISNKQ